MNNGTPLAAEAAPINQLPDLQAIERGFAGLAAYAITLLAHTQPESGRRRWRFRPFAALRQRREARRRDRIQACASLLIGLVDALRAPPAPLPEFQPEPQLQIPQSTPAAASSAPASSAPASSAPASLALAAPAPRPPRSAARPLPHLSRTPAHHGRPPASPATAVRTRASPIPRPAPPIPPRRSLPPPRAAPPWSAPAPNRSN